MPTSTFKPRITLFWRLFLSLLLTVLITSIISVMVERWLNGKELSARMDVQIDSLLLKRQEVVAALQAGDLLAVRQLYRQDRRLMSQIRIYDEQGAIIFPRYRYREERQTNAQEVERDLPSHAMADNRRAHNDKNDSAYEKPSFINEILHPAMPNREVIFDPNNRPELADLTVDLPDGQTAIIQLRPHLRFADVLALQRGNFTVRLLLIILFSTLVCFWLSRTLTRRIGQVQHTVHRMIDGDYQSNTHLSELGSDELGLLAKDVAQLSTRLAESELARKQMLSDISHELRSPLARLDVATELTRDFAPAASRYLDRIDKESARMNELIEQIIHIQSLQMQQYTIDNLENDAVDIVELITEIGKDVCFEFQHKNVRWQWTPPDALSSSSDASLTVLGNQEQLHSALENIIRNAFMHTPAGSTVTAEVTKIPLNNKKEAITISITDEGGGVAEKEVERIFQPFVRLDSARHRETGGYGLGLAIVHAVVIAHEGQITAYNRQDGKMGLVIKITLPAK
ncbi:cell wall metabolism sensor histidine kinase WalK [Psychrobacter sp. CMS30]|uniref:sensor histidine kinase n=1 Tax=Psychrobacter sp. CMS30 TaxID=2774126 RepID=UPI001D11ADEB|nr:ATP-binding protein [Psychrobacter sp. CMS30]